MANRNFAVVKLDDYDTTHSTGGIVVAIKNWPESASDRTMPVFNIETIYGPGHELIPCGDDVEAGWIYTDKTNIFVNSNIG